MKTLVWEEMTPAEKLAVKALSTHSFEAFLRVWFQLSQGERYIPNWHHKYLCRIIDEVISGERRDTIINVAPGAGKTEITSIHFPVYSMLKLKKVRNLSLSFSDSLVKRNSKRVRDLIKSVSFRNYGPVSSARARMTRFRFLTRVERLGSKRYLRQLAVRLPALVAVILLKPIAVA
ncbi:JK_39P [Escherichia phage Jk06]|uniref:JK_39P n=1 Tax=Escherichia phage Jk06 TaxID=2886922 RepID=Q45PX7_9CAUD|nr:terminase large subunit [Escherichia phage Jk06]AAZ29289.1 JK_39P [Escherichia phage Jk06]